MIKQQDLQLRQETLHVAIDGDWALVRAEYHLVNQGAATTVAYGFPVHSSLGYLSPVNFERRYDAQSELH